jgi:DNA-binding NarL/FixJ family response regulator
VTIRVVVADDHPVFLDGLQLLLASHPDIEVVAAATDGPALLAAAEHEDFDVAVVDLDMPGMDGTELTAALLARFPGVGVLVLTMHDDPVSVRRALGAGAQGYVLKAAGHGAIARAVRSVAEGDTVLSGSVGRSVLAAAVTVPAAAGAPDGLSERERAVLALVSDGRTNPQIAGTLHVSVKTVQNHVSNLLAKTGSGSRAALVAWARDRGFPDTSPAGGPRRQKPSEAPRDARGQYGD